jgi:sulfur carrier protein
VIYLRVNGKHVGLAGPTPLLEYVRQLGVDPRAIAVEVNGEILPREAYADCTLSDGDQVEIVRMVGGGTECRAEACLAGPDRRGEACLALRRSDVLATSRLD